MDALIASGKSPDIYIDSMNRAGKYLSDKWAMELSKEYVKDYYPEPLKLTTRAGKVLGVPMSFQPYAMAINMDMMAEIGFEPKNDWTTDDFLRMCELIKAKYDGQKYGMAIDLASGDNDMWASLIASYGAQKYKGRASAFNTPAGLLAINFFKTLYDYGYVPKEAPVMVDDDSLMQWSQGKVATTIIAANWTDGVQEAVDQGILTKPFVWKFFELPKARGVKKVPTGIMFWSVVPHKTTDAARKQAILDLIDTINGAEGQKFYCEAAMKMPTIKGVKLDIANPVYAQIEEAYNRNGIYYQGLDLAEYPRLRNMLAPYMVKMFKGEMTADAVVKAHEAAVNDIFAGR
jgi:ABC-type glycerol-3-phosphate transport system substrate-binding protein